MTIDDLDGIESIVQLHQMIEDNIAQWVNAQGTSVTYTISGEYD